MTDSKRRQWLGRKVHLDAAIGCAVGYLLTPDVVVSRRWLDYPKSPPWMSPLWFVSETSMLHLAEKCDGK